MLIIMLSIMLIIILITMLTIIFITIQQNHKHLEIHQLF